MQFSPENLQDGILRTIQITLGIVLLLNGLYIAGPWYVVIPGSSGVGSVADLAPLYARTVGGAMLLSGIGQIAAGFTPAQRAVGWIKSLFLGTTVLGTCLFTIVLVTRLISIGFVPFTWTLQLGLMLTSGAIALWQGLK